MSADVGVGELVEELEQRGARLPFEIGAFVALEASEGLLRHAVTLDADDVRVTPDGSVVVAQSAVRAEPEEAARSLVSFLARLLVAAGPGVPPDLLELVEDGSTRETSWGLRELHDAIEASLIPINRGASRRVLARLVRESDRPSVTEEPQIDPHELDAELDELLRDPAARTPRPEPAALTPHEAAEADDEPVTERIRFPRPAQPELAAAKPEPAPKRPFAPVSKPDLPSPPGRPAAAALAVSDEPPHDAQEPITKTIRKWNTPAESESQASSPAPGSVSVPVAEAEELETPTETVFSTGSVRAQRESQASHSSSAGHSMPSPEPSYDRPSLGDGRLPKRRSGWGIWLFAAGLGLVIYAGISVGAFEAWLRPAPPASPVEPSGTIDVRVSPATAQIFVFVGRGPARSEGLSVAGAHEFVVFDKGLAPARAIVPENATWTETANGPLYELAIQAQPAVNPSSALDLGVPESNPVSGGRSNGTIRVITNPPGAKVYRFVGRGPIASIPVSSIHEGQEVLVYDSGHETRRAVIGPSDWEPAEQPGGHVATLEVELPRLPGSAPLEPVEQ